MKYYKLYFRSAFDHSTKHCNLACDSWRAEDIVQLILLEQKKGYLLTGFEILEDKERGLL